MLYLWVNEDDLPLIFSKPKDFISYPENNLFFCFAGLVVPQPRFLAQGLCQQHGLHFNSNRDSFILFPIKLLYQLHEGEN